jgi:hypothetical protein
VPWLKHHALACKRQKLQAPRLDPLKQGQSAQGFDFFG